MPIKEIQQTNRQHAVPQNIMDVEFKLIGDLTMRQFSYLLVFGVIAYVVYLTVFGIFKWPLVTFFTLFGLALAFVPIQERGMDEWVVNFFKSVYSPTQMIWKKAPVLPSAFTYENLDVVRQELITLAPTSSRRKLEEYLNYKGIQQEVDLLDIPESEYILKVRDAFAESASTPIVAPTPAVQHVIEETPHEEPKEQSVEPEKKETPQEVKEITPQQPETEKVEAPRTRLRPSLRQRLDSTKRSVSDSLALIPLTPDRHSGRKFTNLLPSEGRLILPIRGEKVLRTSEEKALDVDQNAKAEKLQALLSSIKESREYKDIQFKQLPTSDVNSEAKIIEKEVKQEKEKLSDEITRVTQELTATNISDSERMEKEHLLERLKEQQKKATTDYARLQKQILDLQKKLDDNTQQQAQPTQVSKPVTYSKMQPITSEANVISGIVYDDTRAVMQNIVLLIKNSKGEPVRALRTNSLGQFIISTPLSNGIYSVEVNSIPDKQLSFDIISVEVKGEVIPPIEISGRPN